MRRSAVVLLLAMLTFTAALDAQTVSTAEQRKWAVDATHWLEQHPTGDESKGRAAELLKWWIDVPDLTLSVCPMLLETKNKKIAPAVATQAVFSAGAWLIEHPESTLTEQVLAGVRGGLAAYRVALAADPKMQDQFLDSLVAADAAGKLREGYVDAQVAKCEKAESEKKRR
jgi:hypothetical protein